VSTAYLFASLIWGAIGLGFFVYGRKQRSAGPMLGGILIMGTTYFVASAIAISLICVVVMAGVYGWSRMDRH